MKKNKIPVKKSSGKYSTLKPGEKASSDEDDNDVYYDDEVEDIPCEKSDEELLEIWKENNSTEDLKNYINSYNNQKETQNEQQSNTTEKSGSTTDTTYEDDPDRPISNTEDGNNVATETYETPQNSSKDSTDVREDSKNIEDNNKSLKVETEKTGSNDSQKLNNGSKRVEKQIKASVAEGEFSRLRQVIQPNVKFSKNVPITERDKEYTEKYNNS